MSEKRKALALISGGLDSLLASKVMLEQGIHLEGINFFTGFCVEGHTHAIRKQDRDKLKRNNALWVAEQLGIKLHIVDVVEDYKEVLFNPKHGYGANLNPCLDCKIFMVRKAHEWIREHGFDFIVTGEVIGQRPMSQRKRDYAGGRPRVRCRGSAVAPAVCACFLPRDAPGAGGLGGPAAPATVSTAAAVSRRSSWPSNSAFATMPSRPAVVAFSPTPNIR